MNADRTPRADPRAPGWMAATTVALLCANIALALWIVKTLYFRYSMTTTAYLLWVTDQVSVWTGRLVWAAGVVLFVVLPLARRRPVQLPEVSALTQAFLNAVGGRLASRKWSRAAVAANGVAMAALVAGLLAVSGPPGPAPGGPLVIPTDPESTKMYALSKNTVVVYDREQVTDAGGMGVFQTYTLADAGELQAIAVSYDQQRVFVSDRQTGQVHVLDGTTGRERAHLVVGRTVGALALSADGQTLYAAVVGPIPQGQVVAFDANTLAMTGSIDGVGCPMSLSVSRERLFIATQCGGGHDPLYIVDTRSNEIVRRLQDFAVGHTVVATPSGGHVVVSTGDALHIVSDYMSDSPSIRTIKMPAGRMALANGGRLAVVASAGALVGIDIARAAKCRTAGLEAEPQAVVVSPKGAVFAALPTRLFTTDAQALECE